MMGGDLRMTTGPARGQAVAIAVDGEDVVAYEGESIAAALLASGHRVTRWTARLEEPRGYFCGMGVCPRTASSPWTTRRTCARA